MLSLAFCELEWQMFCCSCGPKWKAEGYVTEGSFFSVGHVGVAKDSVSHGAGFNCPYVTLKTWRWFDVS